MQKFILVLMLSPLAGLGQTNRDSIYANDIYHEYPVNGVPVLNGKGISIRMTCTGFKEPKAEALEIRLRGWVPEDSALNPLVILNGREMNYYFMKYLSPSVIESIDVLNPQAALEKYGEKARHGAIIIQSKSHKAIEPEKPGVIKPTPKP